MKYIQKGGAPPAFRAWCSRVHGTAKDDYRELPADEKTALLAGLLAEQGCLCAYTMRLVEGISAHVEHIKPETVCRAERRGSDLDYDNLVACFPRDGMKSRYRYGAQARGDWWNPGLFVTPLQPNCEQRFRFNLCGEITASAGDAAAAETVRRLALAHASLIEDRRRVIEEFIYGEAGSRPLSEAQARQWLAEVCQRKKDGRFVEFCIAIRHALEDYLSNLQKHRSKRAFARKAKL